MKSTFHLRLSVCAWLLSTVFSLCLRAQHVPITQLNGQYLPIQAVHGGIPCVKIDGQLREVTSGDVILQPAPFYRDGFVRLEEFKIHFSALTSEKDVTNQPPPSLGNIDCSVTLDGFLTASQSLDDCFLILESPATPDHPAQVATVELPRLVAGQKQPLHASMTFGMIPTGENYKIFIFSGRGECQIAKGPLPLDQNVQSEAGYLAHMDHAPVAVILCVPPKYPPSLLARNAAGHATIRCKVGPEGGVLESTVLNADQPEFGEAADAAVKQWLFRPAVMNHCFVETTVDVPFSFHVPKG